ncbi:hypothetical protein MNR01_14745 [Lysobacter sp. S4-A87]|uniref:hypothetical protein n=1 Tax=Lysobacter sp. S4-A87 TaxID=2925843 RepID=UPI001F539BE9|nr:hypothetical protein [Lysobacter sp. S4-A87]UNK48978.1 hypothetical protein MNR01_14745 [Lysobacter sp. S4-A87]
MSDSDRKPVLSRNLRTAWRVVAAIVTLAALVWVLLLLARAWPGLAARSNQISVWLLLLGTVVSIASSILVFEAFVAMAGVFGIRGLPHRQLAHLHFTAQLLKHLPGRVWGIGYQWIAARSAGSLGDWVRANVSHMLFAIFFALWSSWLVLGFSRGAGWGLLSLAAGLVAYWGGWLLVSRPAVTGWISRLPAALSDKLLAAEGLAQAPVAVRFRIFTLFAASWVLYYGAWLLYGASYPTLGAAGGAQLCAYYMLAWFAGYVSLITPSGLGVRELVFAWLAKDFPGDSVALMAIVGRVSMLFVDVVLGLLFAPFAPRER